MALNCEPDRRAEYVSEACGNDAALRREVESLLSARGSGALTTWTQAAYLKLSNPAANDRFGISVAIEADG